MENPLDNDHVRVMKHIEYQDQPWATLYSDS